MKRLKRFIIPIFIPHAGCPHRCSYCDQHAISGAHAGSVTPEFVRDTVIRHVSTRPDWGGERELAFFGGSFTALPQGRQDELLRVGADLIASGYVDMLRVSTRPDGIGKAIVDRLVRYGVKTVELGVQSMSDKILFNARRGHSTQDTLGSVERLTAGGLSWIAQIMPGLPGDDDETMIETAERVAALSPDGVRIYPTVVIDGTELDRMYREGTYVPLTLDQTISVLKVMVELFDRRSVAIIRIGVYPSAGLQRRVVAGPYHPALGSLVYETRLIDAVCASVDAVRTGAPRLLVRVNPYDLSRAGGERGAPVRRLMGRYPEREITLRADGTINRGEVRTDVL